MAVWAGRKNDAPDWPVFTRAILLAMAMLLLCAGLARAEDAPIASAARVGGDGARTRFVADLDRPVSFSIYVLPDPYRVVIDMPEVDFQFPPGTGKTARGLIREYRYGSLGERRSRLVIDTTGPVLIEKSFIVKPQDGQPARIVADLIATDQTTFLKTYKAEARLASTEDAVAEVPSASVETEVEEFAPAGAEAAEATATIGTATAPLPRPKPGAAAAAPAKPVAAKRRDGRRLIVIDPGHGGIDGGAVGQRKTKEKDVVLAFGLELRDQLRRAGKYDVVMTREGDTFLSLRDRVRVARTRAADLFIAVHADTVRGQTARGATIYTVSDKASDAEAEALAQKENRADIIGGVDLGQESEAITDILIELAQRETKNHSLFFARKAVGELKPVTQMTGRPLRSAGFMVLKAPDVPSVLVELGYLSSKADEALLTTPAWRAKVAGAFARAIDGYFATEIAARLAD